MKKYVNGEIIEMTAKEIAEHEAMQSAVAEEQPTEAERIEALESALLELTEVLYG